MSAQAFAFLLMAKTGLRMALMLLAAMAALGWCRAERAETVLERYKSATWGLIALGVFLFGPAYLPALLGHPLGRWPALIFEMAAISTMCAAMILLVATRALLRDVTLARVRRGMIANILVVVGLVAVAVVMG